MFNWDLRRGDYWRAIDDFYDTLHSEDDEPARLERDPFLEQLVRGTVENLTEIDTFIERFAQHWRLDRMPIVDRNVLRLATYEMWKLEAPAAVVIDEAIELVRRYSGDESVSFVNGVLDAIHRQVSALADSNPTETNR